MASPRATASGQGARGGAVTDLSPTTGLLDAELPDVRFRDDQYLAWLYEQNPYGPAIQRNVDEDGVRVAHYALIPQWYRDRDKDPRGRCSRSTR